ncbi:hypothetical protein CAPTEDRAFT_125790 [Capitella teleta]|uniref:Carboxylic ester hydrolase n=1 Tax=Capitella teleta TaxID=283909 RepID=R7VB02_CAPTE|nr:hypothetical protein CAPTEDRAFT_125790 [Capitella teleta]|eukprot:ELU15692.1 hypothetical protein CAPTEDRAFT_125790 [Capitella teleta]
MKGTDSRDVYRFLGVRYGEFTQRFQAPQPMEEWEGNRDAKQYGAICPQDFSLAAEIMPFKPPKNVSEDCLFLNIWSPSLKMNGNLPVMVFIYGGAFSYGYSNLYSGLALTTFHDIIFISINYRLGAFGFLSTGDSAASGNWGLKDQIEALKWIQKYIHVFGGDPSNVTIVGESAGAMSVHYLTLSPLTKGLFKRAVSQSGSAFCPGFLLKQDSAKNYLHKKMRKFIGW